MGVDWYIYLSIGSGRVGLWCALQYMYSIGPYVSGKSLILISAYCAIIKISVQSRLGPVEGVVGIIGLRMFYYNCVSKITLI